MLHKSRIFVTDVNFKVFDPCAVFTGFIRFDIVFLCIFMYFYLGTAEKVYYLSLLSESESASWVKYMHTYTHTQWVVNTHVKNCALMDVNRPVDVLVSDGWWHCTTANCSSGWRLVGKAAHPSICSISVLLLKETSDSSCRIRVRPSPLL